MCSSQYFDPEVCSHSHFEQGSYVRYLQTGDPADRSGYLCGLRSCGQDCTPTWEQCPRIQVLNLFCPHCFEHGRIAANKHFAYVMHDPESGQVCCPICGEFWSSLIERDRDWAMMQVSRHIKNQPARSKSHV